MEYVGTITKADVGKPMFKGYLVQNFIGQIQPRDVGKQVFKYPGTNVLQVENDKQRNERLGKIL
jgi:hypothetical protein